MGDRFGIPRRYAGAAELIAAGGIDAVLVLNSDEYHAECVVDALDHGLHVLVEKPMCLAPREAEAIIAARDRSGATVMVGYMRRFAPAFLEAVERLPSLGRINFARVHDVIGRNRLIVDQTAYVVRPDDLGRSALEERWERGRRLVTDAIGDVPAGPGPRVPAALRAGQPRPVRDARAARPAGRRARRPAVARRRLHRRPAGLRRLRVSYETGVDEQLRFDAHLEVYGDLASLRVQYDTPYVRHLPTTLVVEETEGDALTRSVRRPHLKDPYTHELEYFHAMATTGGTPKTSPEDFVEDLDLFAELIRHLDKAS